MKALAAFALVTLLASSAHAESRIRPAASLDVSYGRASVYGVDMTLLEARIAGGFSTNAKEDTYVDVLGSFSIIRGWTEGGRDLHGSGIFGPMVIAHVQPFRFGGGLEVGYLSAERSTPASDQSAMTGRITGIIGVEPFKIGSAAMTIDLRGHVAAWGQASTPGINLALGVRY